LKSTKIALTRSGDYIDDRINYMYKLKLLSWHIVSNLKYFIGVVEFVVQFCCTFKTSALDV